MQKVFNVRQTLLRECFFEDHNLNEVLFKPTPLTFKLNLAHSHEVINQEQGIYTVTVNITISAYKNVAAPPEQEAGDPIYTATTAYSGVFVIQNFTEEELEVVLNVNAPSLVFPYARAEINRMLSETQLPKPQLQPHQFDAAYQQKKAEEASKSKKKDILEEEDIEIVEDTEDTEED